jgi:hypothetical protein
VRNALGKQVFALAQAKGEETPLEQAIAYALEMP